MSERKDSTFEPEFEAEARRIMDYDPFDPDSENPSTVEGEGDGTAAPSGSAEAAGGDEQPPREGEPKPNTQQTPAQPSPAAPTTDPNLTKQLEDIRKLVEVQTTPAQQTTQQAAPTQPEKKAPAFNVQVPMEIVNAMASEEPAERQVAITTLVNGISNMVYKKAMEDFQQAQAQLVQRIPEMMSQRETLQRQQQNIVQDFYGEYDGYDIEVFKPTVAQVAIRLAQAKGPAFKGWNKEFRDEVATTLQQMFPMIPPKKQGGTAAPAPAATAPAPGKKVPFVAGQGSRPAPQSVDSNTQDMMDVIFG